LFGKKAFNPKQMHYKTEIFLSLKTGTLQCGSFKGYTRQVLTVLT